MDLPFTEETTLPLRSNPSAPVATSLVHPPFILAARALCGQSASGLDTRRPGSERHMGCLLSSLLRLRGTLRSFPERKGFNSSSHPRGLESTSETSSSLPPSFTPKCVSSPVSEFWFAHLHSEEILVASAACVCHAAQGSVNGCLSTAKFRLCLCVLLPRSLPDSPSSCHSLTSNMQMPGSP